MAGWVRREARGVTDRHQPHSAGQHASSAIGVALIVRHGALLIPRSDTRLSAGDEVGLVTDPSSDTPDTMVEALLLAR